MEKYITFDSDVGNFVIHRHRSIQVHCHCGWAMIVQTDISKWQEFPKGSLILKIFTVTSVRLNAWTVSELEGHNFYESFTILIFIYKQINEEPVPTNVIIKFAKHSFYCIGHARKYRYTAIILNECCCVNTILFFYFKWTLQF